MDPESKKLLEDTLTIEKENNKMLHAIRRSMRISTIGSIIYWIVIIGISIGAFYFLKPYGDQIVKSYGSFNAALKNFKR